MKQRTHRFLVTTALVAVSSFSALPVSHAANSGLALMKIEQGARPVGMGGAFVSIADEPNATFYNPATALTANEFRGSFSHTEHWENIRLETVHFGARLWPRWSLHGGVRFASIDDLEGRDDVPSDDPVFEFNSHDASFKAGLAWQPVTRVSVGAAIGWFLEEIEGFRGSAVNVDLGAAVQLTEALAVGASVVNLGPDFKLEKSGRPGSRDIDLPTTWRGGASYRYRAFLAALDIVYLDDDLHAHIGAEAQLHELFQVRAGYMANYDTKSISAGASFTERNLSVDYAFVPFTDNLGTSHQFSISVRL